MFQRLSFFVVIMFFMGCDQESEEIVEQKEQAIDSLSVNVEFVDPLVTSFEDIQNYLYQPPEIFTIKNTKDTVLIGAKGTKIFLPANSLVYSDGTHASDSISVKLKECYSFTDFIANNLTTTSHGEMLESGGMVKLTISGSKGSLEVEKGKQYGLFFPKNGLENDMELFVGNHDSTNNVVWSQDQTSTNRNTFEKDNAGFPDVICKVRVSDRTVSVSQMKVSWKLLNGSDVFEYVEDNCDIPRKLKKEICDKQGKVVGNVKLNKEGKIYNIEIEKHYNSEFDKIYKDLMMKVPPFDLSSMGGYSEDQTYAIGIDVIQVVDQNYDQNYREKDKKFRNQTINQIGGSEINNFVFTCSKLGWINCDRFLNDQSERVDFIVKSISGSHGKTVIIFNGINSLMDGGVVDDSFIFRNVPIGRSIKIVSVSYKNSKPILSIEETTIGKEPFELVDFKEYSLASLEKELGKI